MLSEEQKKQRLKGIGGSDAGAVLGINPYKSPLDVYLEKTGELIPEDISNKQHVHFGNKLEDLIAKEYEERTGNKVRRVNKLLAHKKYKFMIANVDRIVEGQSIVLECKTSGEYMKKNWGPDGSDVVPDSYIAQCIHYMIVTGRKQADLAVLIGGQDFRIYHIGYDESIAESIIKKEKDFWDMVINKTPPPPSNSSDIYNLYPTDNGKSLKVNEEIKADINDLILIKSRIKDQKALETSITNRLKKFIGDYSSVLDSKGETLLTYKKSKEVKKFDVESFKKNHRDLYFKFLITSKASRRLLLK